MIPEPFLHSKLYLNILQKVPNGDVSILDVSSGSVQLALQTNKFHFIFASKGTFKESPYEFSQILNLLQKTPPAYISIVPSPAEYSLDEIKVFLKSHPTLTTTRAEEFIVITLKPSLRPLSVHPVDLSLSQLEAKLKQFRPGRRIDCILKHEELTLYDISIIDCKVIGPRKCAAFIVPEGSENEYLFSQKKGQLSLAKQQKIHRIVFVLRRPFQCFPSMDGVQKELAKPLHIFQLSQTDSFPIVTVGEEGKRHLVYRDEEILVEDVEISDIKSRRLFFSNHLNLVQTEIPFAKNGKLDYTSLASNYQTCLLQGFRTLPNSLIANCLIIGLGGGAFPLFLLNTTLLNIHVVDLSQKVVQTAETFFGLPRDDPRLTVHIMDGIEYLYSTAEVFHSIVIDVDVKDASLPLNCPPEVFLSEKCLRQAKQLLDVELGFLAINFVCRDMKLRSQVLERVSAVFPVVETVKSDEDVNEIILAFAKS